MTISDVDVLLPVYNAEKTIGAALRSIQDQSVSNICIIVINDGSTDSTLEKLESAKQADPRIFIINKENSGIVDALNVGLSHCESEFVARMDADDISYKERFKIQLDYLKSHHECVAVSCHAKIIDEFDRWNGAIAAEPDPSIADPTSLPSIEPYLMHPFLMVRRESINKVGGYRFVHHAEDTDLYWRLRELGTLHNIPQVLGDYRMTSASITNRSLSNIRISAIYSQLAAISAERRRRSEADMLFPKSQVFEMVKADSAEGMIKIASSDLTVGEADYLRRAFAMKLLWWCTCRPMVLDDLDCLFVKQELSRIEKSFNKSKARDLGRQRSIVAAKLLKNGQFGSFLSMVEFGRLPQTCLSFCVSIVPAGLKRDIKHIVFGFKRSLESKRN